MQGGQLSKIQNSWLPEDMERGRLLVIVDDARVSRLICHVAELYDMACHGINKMEDLASAYKKARPDVIFLDPELGKKRGTDVFRELAEQHVSAAIVLTSGNLDQADKLEQVADSYGLDMLGVLPDVFDAETLKQEFISISRRIGKRLKLDIKGISQGVGNRCCLERNL